MPVPRTGPPRLDAFGVGVASHSSIWRDHKDMLLSRNRKNAYLGNFYLNVFIGFFVD